jgi:hypothetical protein
MPFQRVSISNFPGGAKKLCGPSKYLAGFLYKEQFRNHTCSYPVKKVSLV